MKTKQIKNKVYTPGLSIEEIKKKYSLKTVYKLASNENPLPPPEGLLKVLNKKLKTLNRYPTYTQPAVQAVSKYFKVPRDQVVLGNGSSELIDKLMQAYSEKAILTSEHSFPLYTINAQARGLHVYKAKMEKNLKISPQNMLSILKKTKSIQLVFISNPNNPTGSYLSHTEIEKFLSAVQGQNVKVVLDEAYWGYARAKDFPNSLALLKKFPHLILLRSLSKRIGLAGLRAGVMLAHPSIIKEMKKNLSPFNVNSLALQAMVYCLSHPHFKKYLTDSQKLVWKGLDYFYLELKKLNLKFYPSQANFLLFSSKNSAVFSTLLKKGVILRPIPTLKNHLRISIGLEHENKKVIQGLRQMTL